MPPPVSRLAGSAAVAALAISTALAGSRCLADSSQVLAAGVVARHRQRCCCCQRPAHLQASSTLLLHMRVRDDAFATNYTQLLHQSIKRCRMLVCCCCPVCVPLLEVQQVTPHHLLAAAHAAPPQAFFSNDRLTSCCRKKTHVRLLPAACSSAVSSARASAGFCQLLLLVPWRPASVLWPWQMCNKHCSA